VAIERLSGGVHFKDEEPVDSESLQIILLSGYRQDRDMTILPEQGLLNCKNILYQYLGPADQLVQDIFGIQQPPFM